MSCRKTPPSRRLQDVCAFVCVCVRACVRVCSYVCLRERTPPALCAHPKSLLLPLSKHPAQDQLARQHCAGPSPSCLPLCFLSACRISVWHRELRERCCTLNHTSDSTWLPPGQLSATSTVGSKHSCVTLVVTVLGMLVQTYNRQHLHTHHHLILNTGR